MKLQIALTMVTLPTVATQRTMYAAFVAPTPMSPYDKKHHIAERWVHVCKLREHSYRFDLGIDVDEHPLAWMDDTWMDDSGDTYWHWFETARITPSCFNTSFYRSAPMYPWLSTHAQEMMADISEDRVMAPFEPIPSVTDLTISATRDATDAVEYIAFPAGAVWPSVRIFCWRDASEEDELRKISLTSIPNVVTLHFRNMRAVRVCDWDAAKQLQQLDLCSGAELCDVPTKPIPSLTTIRVDADIGVAQFACTVQASWVVSLDVGMIPMPPAAQPMPNLRTFTVRTALAGWDRWLSVMSALETLHLIATNERGNYQLSAHAAQFYPSSIREIYVYLGTADNQGRVTRASEWPPILPLCSPDEPYTTLRSWIPHFPCAAKVYCVFYAYGCAVTYVNSITNPTVFVKTVV